MRLMPWLLVSLVFPLLESPVRVVAQAPAPAQQATDSRIWIGNYGDVRRVPSHRQDRAHHRMLVLVCWRLGTHFRAWRTRQRRGRQEGQARQARWILRELQVGDRVAQARQIARAEHGSAYCRDQSMKASRRPPNFGWKM